MEVKYKLKNSTLPLPYPACKPDPVVTSRYPDTLHTFQLGAETWLCYIFGGTVSRSFPLSVSGPHSGFDWFP